jgi:hypothetical protein
MSRADQRSHPQTPPLPSTVWLLGPDDDTRGEPSTAPAVLPAWAITRIRSEFTRRPSKPAPLLRIHIRDTEPGMDTRTPCVTSDASAGGRITSSWPVLLAELHPDTLSDTSGVTGVSGDMPGAMEDGWPGFFHRAHRILPTDGRLLLAPRQRRDAGRLTDPLGTAPAENSIRAVQAACWYSCRIPPRRSLRPTFSWVMCAWGGCGNGAHGYCLVYRLVGPVKVVVRFELAKCVAQMALVPDEGAVRSSWRQVWTQRP